MAKKETQENWFFEGIKTIITAVVLVVIVHTLLFKPFVIPSPSMYPTLMIGDYLFVSKYAYGYSRFSLPFSPNLFEGRIFAHKPKMGDIVVFRPPQDLYSDWVKRVIGLPGDKVQMVEGIIHINGKPVGMEYEREQTWRDEKGQQYTSKVFIETLPNGLKHKIFKTIPFGEAPKDDTRVFSVPEGHYFMMGDNRDFSGDSRFSVPGYIPFENLIGRAEIIFFSTALPTENGAWWMIWRWPTATRYNRILKLIH